MKITIIRKSMRYVHKDETPPPEDITTATVPDDSKCQWDANQHTLIVKAPSGSVLTAFTSVFTFYTEGVVLEGAKP